MERLGILTGADLAQWSREQLDVHFGSSGEWYWKIARGIDERPVRPDRPYKSVSAERTFDSDLAIPANWPPSWSGSRALPGRGSSARRSVAGP